MTEEDNLIADFEDIRNRLHDTFIYSLNTVTAKLRVVADELDNTNRAVKKSKVAGNTACVIGGVLGAVGFGLSFVTFGASLGLCIAGGVIGGAGGITTGAASIVEYVKAKEAKKKAEEELERFNKEFLEVLEKCKEIFEILAKSWDIEKTFPDWFTFWADVLFESGKVAYNFGWTMVTKTVLTAIRLAKGIDVSTDAASAALPLFRTLGTASKGFHIFGGVVGALFLPVDVYYLVSNAVEIHKDTAHRDAKKIREIVEKIEKKCISRERVDGMIDRCVAVIKAERINFT